MCHFLDCIIQLEHSRQLPSPAQGREEHPWDAVLLRTREGRPASRPLTAIPEGVQELLPSPQCTGGGEAGLINVSPENTALSQGLFLPSPAWQLLAPPQAEEEKGLETDDAVRSL